MRYKKGDRVVTEEWLQKSSFSEEQKNKIREHPESPALAEKTLKTAMKMYSKNQRGMENAAFVIPQEFFLGFLDDAVGAAVGAAAGDVKGRKVQRSMEKAFGRARRQSPVHTILAGFAPDILDVITGGATYIPRKGYKVFKGITKLAKGIGKSKKFKAAAAKGPEAVMELVKSRDFWAKETGLRALYGAGKGAAIGVGETSVDDPDKKFRNMIVAGGMSSALSLIGSAGIAAADKKSLYKALGRYINVDPKKAPSKLRKIAKGDPELSQKVPDDISDENALMLLAKQYEKKGYLFKGKKTASPRSHSEIQTKVRAEGKIYGGEAGSFLSKMDERPDVHGWGRTELGQSFQWFAKEMKAKTNPADLPELNTQLQRMERQVDTAHLSMNKANKYRQDWDAEINYDDPAALKSIKKEMADFYRTGIKYQLEDKDLKQWEKVQADIGERAGVAEDLDPSARLTAKKGPGSVPITKYGALSRAGDFIEENVQIPTLRKATQLEAPPSSLGDAVKKETIRSAPRDLPGKIITGQEADMSGSELEERPESELDMAMDALAEKFGIGGGAIESIKRTIQSDAEPDSMPEEEMPMEPEMGMEPEMDLGIDPEMVPEELQDIDPRQAMIELKRLEKEHDRELALQDKIISTPLPRYTQKFLENADFAMAKLGAQRPDIMPQWAEMLKNAPHLLEEHLMGLSMEDPMMLEHDPFGRINDRVFDNGTKNSIRTLIAQNPEITNLKRVEQLDELNRTGIYKDSESVPEDQTQDTGASPPPRNRPPGLGA